LEMDQAGGRFSSGCADLVRFLAFGGMRLGEAAKVTWQDVDVVRGEIRGLGDEKFGPKNGE